MSPKRSTAVARGLMAVALLTTLCRPGFATAHPLAVGNLVTPTDGGEVFGFDIDRSGTDGVLATRQTVNSNGSMRVSVETFDQASGAITRTFAVSQGRRDAFAVDGIFAGDVALVTHDVSPSGSIPPIRRYEVMNPVTAGAFTGAWTPPIPDVDILQAGVNQTTTTSLLFGVELKRQNRPVLIVSDIATNTFPSVIHLDPTLFRGANQPKFAQYTAKNQAVIAVSPDQGKPSGAAPIIALVDQTSGKITRFAGFNDGLSGAGFVNGLAVDPNTGVAATTTELNAEVEFYDLNTRTRILANGLICTRPTNQNPNGASIAVDPVNKLFVIAHPDNCFSGAGGALEVYDEQGGLVGYLPGAFFFAAGEPAPVLNPATRTGWVLSTPPSGSGHRGQLQQFFY